ncbi:MAG: acyltransferase family protein [Xanthobacteraceae bacterium]
MSSHLASPTDGLSLTSIQSLRGLAAFMVVVHHALGAAGQRFVVPDAISAHLFYLGDLGASGVDIFFVISGFIMVYSNRSKFGDGAASVDFLARRIIRIVPLYWIFTLVMLSILIFVPAMASTLRFGLRHAIESFLFIPTINSNGEYVPVLNVGWTLTYEMYFYVIFAVLLPTSLRLSLVVTSVLFVTSAALGCLYQPTGPIPSMLTNQILIEFVIGECIGVAFIHGWLPGRRAALGLLALVVAFYVLHFFVGPVAQQRLFFRGLPAGCLVLSVLCLERAGVQVFPVWTRAIGDSSYSLYLIHTLLIAAIYKVYAMLNLGDVVSVDVLILVAIIAAVVAAQLVFALLERPITSGLVNLWRRLPPREAVEPAT